MFLWTEGVPLEQSPRQAEQNIHVKLRVYKPADKADENVLVVCMNLRVTLLSTRCKDGLQQHRDPTPPQGWSSVNSY
jgi:hypothetical protein